MNIKCLGLESKDLMQEGHSQGQGMVLIKEKLLKYHLAKQKRNPASKDKK